MKAVTGLLLLFVLAFTAPAFSQTKKKPAKTRTVTRQIFNGSVAVDPGKLQSFPFFVGPQGAIVSGRFQAKGGNRNDIRVYILDVDGLENVSNGNGSPTFYNSGSVTVANINQYIAAEGYYFLVFSNQEGWTNRNVFGQIIYRYTLLKK